MHLPVTGLTLLAGLLTAGHGWPAGIALVGAALTMLLSECATKRRQLQKTQAAVPSHRLMAALLREHGASLYHLSANGVRYYSLPLLLMGWIWPVSLPLVAFLVLLAPISDHRRLRPSLSLPIFTGLYILEMAAYQLGIWRGCWQRRTLQPLLPKILWRR